MHDAPSPAQIIDAASRFLRERAAGALAAGDRDEHAAYAARVVANLLAIAGRELAEAPEVGAAERARALALLAAGPGAAPAAPDATLAELNRRLAEQIAEGRLTLATPGLAAHLWQVTLAKLAVDQPGYSTYRARQGAEGPQR